jgi:hypothetical protein
MKSLILALALFAGLVSPASSAPWGYSPAAYDAQGQKARHGRDQGGPPQGRPAPPPERQMQGDPRRGQQQLNDDERRALHRDLDKANRELYRRR